MNWASAELKIDIMKDEIKSLKKTIKLLELDLVKTKQNLGNCLSFLRFLIKLHIGEAMNAAYDYEKKNSILIEKLKENNIPLDGLSVKGAISKDKHEHRTEDTEFVKKFTKKGAK